MWWEHVGTAPERNPGSGLHSGHGSNPCGGWEKCKLLPSSPTASALQSQHAFAEASRAGLENKTQFKIKQTGSFRERSTPSACFHDLDEPCGGPRWLLSSWLCGEF